MLRPRGLRSLNAPGNPEGGDLTLRLGTCQHRGGISSCSGGLGGLDSEGCSSAPLHLARGMFRPDVLDLPRRAPAGCTIWTAMAPSTDGTLPCETRVGR